RDRAAAAGQRAHHSVPDLQRPQRGPAMSVPVTGSGAGRVAVQTAGRSRSSSFRLSRIAIYATLILFALFYLMPVYVLLVTGLKSFTEVTLDRMWALPQGFSLDSFIDAWLGNPTTAIPGIAKNFANTILLTVPATIISAILGSVNGYVLSKWKFR